MKIRWIRDCPDNRHIDQDVQDLARPDALRMIRRGRALLAEDEVSVAEVLLTPTPEEEDVDSD